MRNALKVTRIHLISSLFGIAMPWAVLAFVFAVNVAIFSLIRHDTTGLHQTGGLASIYIFALVANLQTMTQLYPFTAMLSITRRAFLGGTAILVLAQSLVTGIVFTVLRSVERGTGGWGVRMRFFGGGFIDRSNPVAQVLTYAVPFLLVSTLGLTIGAVFRRWAQVGLWGLSLASVGVIGAGAYVVTWRGWWVSVGHFLTETSGLLPTTAYPFALVALLAVGTWLVLRRATP